MRRAGFKGRYIFKKNYFLLLNVNIRVLIHKWSKNSRFPPQHFLFTVYNSKKI